MRIVPSLSVYRLIRVETVVPVSIDLMPDGEGGAVTAARESSESQRGLSRDSTGQSLLIYSTYATL